jgi:hypothetical protein
VRKTTEDATQGMSMTVGVAIQAATPSSFNTFRVELNLKFKEIPVCRRGVCHSEVMLSFLLLSLMLLLM